MLLTIDLTSAVVDEAIENNHSCVVAYHPIIFKPLKSVTLADSQQSSLLRLASAGISVYCPHTAVDAVPWGMADWLCDIVAGRKPGSNGKDGDDASQQNKTAGPSSTDDTGSHNARATVEAAKNLESENTSAATGSASTSSNVTKDGRSNMNRAYSRPTYPEPPQTPLEATRRLSPPSSNDYLSHTRSVVVSSSWAVPHDHRLGHGTGFGRLITFDESQPLTNLIDRIGRGLNNPKGFLVAIPQNRHVEDMSIRTVGICPGSGASVLLHDNMGSKAGASADLIFTGEMSHHDALAITERGGAVVTLFHSNSERGYLAEVMKGKLQSELVEYWQKIRQVFLEGRGPQMPRSATTALSYDFLRPESQDEEGEEEQHDRNGGSGSAQQEDDAASNNDKAVEQEARSATPSSSSLSTAEPTDQDTEAEEERDITTHVPEELRDILRDREVTVEVSRVDRDPYGIVVLQD